MVAASQRKSWKGSVIPCWRGGWWILAIIALALALRVLYLLQAREHLFFNQFSDSLYYHQWALRIVGGQPGPPVFYMGPLYPHLLAVLYRLLGPYSEVALWFQVLLGAVSCGLIYLLGRMALGRAVGLLAALMGALYGVEIFYEGLLLMTTTLYALNLLLLISILWALRRDRWYLWIVPGLLLGLSALGRASVLAFFPLMLLGLVLLTRGRGEGGVRWPGAALAVLAGLLLVLVPVTLHNVIVGGDLVFITSNMGLNFFIGNNPDAQGYYQKPRGLDLSEDIYGAKIAGVHMGRGLKPSEVSRFWLGKAMAFVRSQPGAFFKSTLNKLLFFWNAYEIPQVENVQFFKRSAPLLRGPLLGFSILGPLGLLGMALSLRRWREVFFLLTFVLALMGATILFFVISRLRLQVCSVLMVFAAYALTWMWDRLKKRDMRRLIIAILGFAALGLLVNWPHPSLSPDRDMAQAQRFMALSLRNRGQLQQASWEYEQAIAIYPQLADTYVDLATLRMDQGRPDEALELYRKALQVDPMVSGVHLNFGNFYATLGRWEEAIAEFRAETKTSPYSLKAYESLYEALQEKEKLQSKGE